MNAKKKIPSSRTQKRFIIPNLKILKTTSPNILTGWALCIYAVLIGVFALIPINNSLLTGIHFPLWETLAFVFGITALSYILPFKRIVIDTGISVFYIIFFMTVWLPFGITHWDLLQTKGAAALTAVILSLTFWPAMLIHPAQQNEPHNVLSLPFAIAGFSIPALFLLPRYEYDFIFVISIALFYILLSIVIIRRIRRSEQALMSLSTIGTGMMVYVLLTHSIRLANISVIRIPITITGLSILAAALLGLMVLTAPRSEKQRSPHDTLIVFFWPILVAAVLIMWWLYRLRLMQGYVYSNDGAFIIHELLIVKGIGLLAGLVYVSIGALVYRLKSSRRGFFTDVFTASGGLIMLFLLLFPGGIIGDCAAVLVIIITVLMSKVLKSTLLYKAAALYIYAGIAAHCIYRIIHPVEITPAVFGGVLYIAAAVFIFLYRTSKKKYRYQLQLYSIGILSAGWLIMLSQTIWTQVLIHIPYSPLSAVYMYPALTTQCIILCLAAFLFTAAIKRKNLRMSVILLIGISIFIISVIMTIPPPLSAAAVPFFNIRGYINGIALFTVLYCAYGIPALKKIDVKNRNTIQEYFTGLFIAALGLSVTTEIILFQEIQTLLSASLFPFLIDSIWILIGSAALFVGVIRQYRYIQFLGGMMIYAAVCKAGLFDMSPFGAHAIFIGIAGVALITIYIGYSIYTRYLKH